LIAPAPLPGIAPAPPALGAWCVTACALAVMLGHVYPLWFGLRGGKGVATLVGAVLGIDPWLLAPMVLTWLAAVVLFGFVGLASMLATLALAVEIAIGNFAPRQPQRRLESHRDAQGARRHGARGAQSRLPHPRDGRAARGREDPRSPPARGSRARAHPRDRLVDLLHQHGPHRAGQSADRDERR